MGCAVESEYESEPFIVELLVELHCVKANIIANENSVDSFCIVVRSYELIG